MSPTEHTYGTRWLNGMSLKLGALWKKSWTKIACDVQIFFSNQCTIVTQQNLFIVSNSLPHSIPVLFLLGETTETRALVQAMRLGLGSRAFHSFAGQLWVRKTRGSTFFDPACSSLLQRQRKKSWPQFWYVLIPCLIRPCHGWLRWLIFPGKATRWQTQVLGILPGQLKT